MIKERILTKTDWDATVILHYTGSLQDEALAATEAFWASEDFTPEPGTQEAPEPPQHRLGAQLYYDPHKENTAFTRVVDRLASYLFQLSLTAEDEGPAEEPYSLMVKINRDGPRHEYVLWCDDPVSGEPVEEDKPVAPAPTASDSPEPDYPTPPEAEAE